MLALVDGVVCTGDAVLRDAAVLVDGDGVVAVVPPADVPGAAEAVALDGAFVAPGLVDLQVNGGGDVLVGEDPTAAAIAAVAAAHRRLGTTALLPTLISADAGTVSAAAAAVAAARRDGVPGVLGLHVEGPFLNPAHRGAHDARRLRTMRREDADALASLGVPALVTLAPECVDGALIHRLAAAGIRVAAGHSAAGPAELARAVAEGLRLVTHVFNAMSGLRAREPGLIGAALAEDRVACGLIADGHHVADTAIRLALRCKPPGGLFVVSDAMPPVGGTRPAYRLGDVEIAVREGRSADSHDALAGSAAPLATGVERLVRLGVAVPIALRMASTIPADLVGAGGTCGRLAAGRRADLVVVASDGHLLRVMAGGRFI